MFAVVSANRRLPKFIGPLRYTVFHQLVVLPILYVTLAVGIRLPVANTLAPDISPVALTVPPVATLPAVTVPAALTIPDTVTALLVLSNVNPEVALVVPLSLKRICVLAPGALMLPEILPIKLLAVTLPVALISPVTY